MRLWIDATRSSDARVFGMSLLERHLKAVRHLRVDLAEIVIVVPPDRTDFQAPDDPGLACPVRVERQSGPIDALLKAALKAGGPLLVTDAATLADARLYAFLADRKGSCIARSNRAALARVEPDDADRILAAGSVEAALGALPELTQAKFPSFIPKLRRDQPFYLFAVLNAAEARATERFLFWSNYKGSTDFFTKYVYPPLVWAVVPGLARARVHPNSVTLVGTALTVLAVPLFANGFFWWGFACAYGMSILDSVDGKLARLTFTDSWLGNVLDHGLDLIHPPFWYFAWAWGLAAGDLTQPIWAFAQWMCGFYILDRLILSVYRKKFGRGLHTHAPVDAWVRTFISRRNINLPLFTVAYGFGFGPEAIFIMLLWQILTCAYHGGRTLWILTVERPIDRSRPEP